MNLLFYIMFCSRRRGTDSDAESSKETSSDGSSNCGAEKKTKANLQDECIQDSSISGSQRALQMNTPSAESSSDESDSCYHHGQLVFEYMERDPPFCREPLTDKVGVFLFGFITLSLFILTNINLHSTDHYPCIPFS